MEGRRRIPAIGDLGAAANPLRLLSELAGDLRLIRKHTVHMDREVTGMHASVERIEVEMRELSTRIGALDKRMEAVEGAVERLEPYVADLNLALRPFRRARARVSSRPAVTPGEAAEEPPTERSATG